MGVEERREKSYRWNNRSWLNNAKILIPFSENVTFSLLWILHIFIPIWQGTKCRHCSVLNRQKYPKKLLPVGQHVISNRLKIDQLIIIHYTSPPGPHGVQTKSFVSRPQVTNMKPLSIFKRQLLFICSITRIFQAKLYEKELSLKKIIILTKNV